MNITGRLDVKGTNKLFDRVISLSCPALKTERGGCMIFRRLTL